MIIWTLSCQLQRWSVELGSLKASFGKNCSFCIKRKIATESQKLCKKLVSLSREFINLLFLCKPKNCFRWHVNIIFHILKFNDICNISCKQNCLRISCWSARHLNGDTDGKQRQIIFSLFLKLATKYHFFKVDMLSLYSMKAKEQ